MATTEDDSDFNFEKWIAEYKLNDIKQCFIDHDMITLDTVNMNNPNFSNLMADQRIILKAYLLQNVINGMQSLEKLREQKTKHIEKPKENKKLIFMTENETKVIRNIQQYIENVNNLQNELKNKMDNDFQVKKEGNCQQIETNEKIHLQKLDQMSSKISKTFQSLHKNLDKRREILQDTINEYQQQIDIVTVSHNEKITNINDTLQNCLSTVDEEMKYLQDCMEEMFFVANNHTKETMECHSTIDHNNNAIYKYHYNSRDIVKSRENKLIKMCHLTTEHYFKGCKLLYDELDKINKYTDFELKLIDVDLPQNAFTINIDNNVYRDLCDDVEQLIKLTQKQDIEEEEKDAMEEYKYNEDEEKAEELIYIDNSKRSVTTYFDEHWYNATKWQLSNDRKTINGINYDPFIAYCVYFLNNGYDEGVHYLTMKCDKTLNDNGDISKINCCIGVTSERNRNWAMDGICDNWPNKGSYSYFNGSKDRPYWYSNESITIKLDTHNLIVYYYKSNEQSLCKDLVKQERINKANNFYFMMCAESDPALKYSLVL